MGQLRFGAIATTKEKRMCGSRDDRNAISNCHRRRIMPASITLTVLQLCLIILSVSKVAIAGSRWHVGPEWYNDISAKGPGSCTFAPRPHPPPYEKPKCKPYPEGKDPRTEYERVREQGWRLAPKVYFHPLDDSYLSDMAEWTKNATFFNPLNGHPMTYREVMDAVRDAPDFMHSLGPYITASHMFRNVRDNLTSDTLEEIALGDPIVGAQVGDPDTGARRPFNGTRADRPYGAPLFGGYSSSRQYYTATNPYQHALPTDDEEGAEVSYEAVVFRFTYFYSWNGCSNQMLSLVLKGMYQGAEYYMCPFGSHEGDAERVQLWVCASEWDDANPWAAIKVAQYAQHAWLSQMDCTAGECPFITDERGDKRLAAYSSLFSHATLPHATPLEVYEMVNSRLILNIDAMFIADRTSDQGPVFLPDANNTVRLPLPAEMNDTQRQDLEWALFPGSLGGNFMSASKRTVTCFFDNITAMRPCNDSNPAVWYIKFFLNKAGTVTSSSRDVIWSNNIPLDALATRSYGYYGPLFRAYTFRPWDEPRAAPLWSRGDDRDVFCPFSGDPSETSDEVYGISNISLATFLGLCTGLLVGAGVVFAVALHWPRLHSLHKPWEPAMDSSRSWIRGKRKAHPASDAPAAHINASGGAASWAGGVPAAAVDSSYISASATSFVATRTSVAASDTSPLLPLDSGTPSIYYALRHALWMGIGSALYIAGIVMAAMGLDQVFVAIDRVVQLTVFDQIRNGIIAVLVLFGVCQLVTLLVTLVFRSQRTVSLGCVSFTNPLALWRGVSRAGWRFHTVVSGLLVIQINVAMLLFTFGVVMWIARYGLQNVCEEAVSRLFGVAEEIPVLCVDLSLIGIDRQFCGRDIARVCSIWSGLKMDLLVWGSLCFILAHLLFLVMCVHQSSQLQTLEAVNEVSRAHLQADGRIMAGGEGGKGVGDLELEAMPSYTPPSALAAGAINPAPTVDTVYAADCKV